MNDDDLDIKLIKNYNIDDVSINVEKETKETENTNYKYTITSKSVKGSFKQIQKNLQAIKDTVKQLEDNL